jgi:predicted PurR-regulated permease PerM
LLFIAVLLSLFFGSVTDFLVKKGGMPRGLAFASAVTLTLLSIWGLGALLVPPVVAQTQQLIAVLPDYIRAWQDGLARLVIRYPVLRDVVSPQGEIVNVIISQIQVATGRIVPTVINVGHQLVNIVSILVMSIYLALHPALYREWLIALFPPIHRDVVRDVLTDMKNTLRSWLVAQILAMTILATLTAFGLFLLQVPYWLTFGIVVGVIVIVPFFGTLVGTLLPAIFVLGGTGIWGFGPGVHFLLVLALGVLAHIVEGNFVLPLITAKKVEIPPVLTMMSVLIVARLFGIGGVIVAVPLAAIVLVLVRRIVIQRIYEGMSFRRVASDRALVLRVPVLDASVIPGERVDVLRDVTRRAAVNE